MKAKFQILVVITFIGFNYSTLVAQTAAWVAPKAANEVKNPFKDNAAAAAKGKTLFNQMCALCHGKLGDGTGGGGATLKPKPANFLSAAIKNEKDGALFWKMTEGKPPMASYKDMLTADQRWQLVTYIRQLQK